MEIINSDKDNAEKLMNEGYAVISNKHNKIARIDKKDWKNYGVNEDTYRRNFSKDVKIISPNIHGYIKNSKEAEFGFQPKNNLNLFIKRKKSNLDHTLYLQIFLLGIGVTSVILLIFYLLLGI